MGAVKLTKDERKLNLFAKDVGGKRFLIRMEKVVEKFFLMSQLLPDMSLDRLSYSKGKIIGENQSLLLFLVNVQNCTCFYSTMYIGEKIKR